MAGEMGYTSLYDVAGGIPGGGPMGAMFAGQALQQEQMSRLAEMYAKTNQAQINTSQEQRMLSLNPYEQRVKAGLANEENARAGYLGAQTGEAQAHSDVAQALVPSTIGAGQAEQQQKYTTAQTAKGQVFINYLRDNSRMLDTLPEGSMRDNFVGMLAGRAGVDPNDPMVKGYSDFLGKSGQEPRAFSELGMSQARTTPGYVQATDVEAQRAAAEKYTAEQHRLGTEYSADTRLRSMQYAADMRRVVAESKNKTGVEMYNTAQEHLGRIASGQEPDPDGTMRPFWEAQAEAGRKQDMVDKQLQEYVHKFGILNIPGMVGGQGAAATPQAAPGTGLPAVPGQTPQQPGAQAQQPNVTEQQYNALPDGATYFWNGQQLTKGKK